jgi:hypothetical protein
MNDRLQLAAQRRQQLVAHCGAQRAQLTAQLQPLGHTLESVKTGLRVAGRFRQHPEWLAAGVIGVLLLTPRRLSAWMRGGTQLLRVWRRMAPQVRMLLGRQADTQSF